MPAELFNWTDNSLSLHTALPLYVSIYDYYTVPIFSQRYYFHTCSSICRNSQLKAVKTFHGQKTEIKQKICKTKRSTAERCTPSVSVFIRHFLTPDLCPDGIELIINMIIASVNMIDILNGCHTLCHQSGNHHGSPAS